MLVEQAGERRVGGEAGVLGLVVEVDEVGTEAGQSLGVALLEADDGAVELPLGPAPTALDAGPPGQFLDRAEGQEPVEAGVAAMASGERSAGPDAGRVDEERTEEAVDVVGDPGRLGTGRAVAVRRDQPVDGRLQDGVLLFGQPPRDGATLGP